MGKRERKHGIYRHGAAFFIYVEGRLVKHVKRFSEALRYVGDEPQVHFSEALRYVGDEPQVHFSEALRYVGDEPQVMVR